MIRNAHRVLGLCIVTSAAAQPSPFDWKTVEAPDGSQMEFRAQLPGGFDPDAGWPIALVFAGGAQDREAVWNELAAHWFRECQEHGFGVVLPVAPAPGHFDGGVDAPLRALLHNLRTGMRVEGNRIHVIGIGEGARGATAVVAAAPFEFATLITTGDFALADVAEERIPSSVTRRSFEQFDASTVWQALAERRDALRPDDTDAGRVHAAIDDWHDAAARADGERYFGAFTDDGVFLGTDPDERWTIAEFREFGAKYFERRSAWIYIPMQRHVAVAPGGDVAWFDEELGHARFGACRGTGVVRRIDGTWKLAHYSLTVPVPNALLEDVVAQIRDARAPK